MSSIDFVLIYPSSESSYVYDSSIEAKIDQSSSKLRLFFNKSPYLNCEKVIMSPVCSCDDVAY